MKFKIPTIKLSNGLEMPKMGIGTWGFGGYMSKSPYNDDKNDIEQIRYQLEQGLMMIDTWLAQAEGQMVKIVSEAINGISRDKFFIVAKLDVKNFIKVEDVEKTVNQYLEELNLDFVDMIQIHKPQYDGINAQQCVEEMNRMIDVGKARFLGISNANVEALEEAINYTRYPFELNEVNYSVIDRTNDDNGTTRYCQDKGIKVLAYKPLARGAVNYLSGVAGPEMFRELAAKYNKTPNQIALNWVLSKPNFMLWMKSANRSHINENLDCMSFTLEPEETKKIDEWRN
jgi:diketogulonate reductase-like aldo/keto reductase